MTTAETICNVGLCLNCMLWGLSLRSLKNLYRYKEWLNANYTRGRGVSDISAWVARDIDGRLFAYQKEPFFIGETGVWFQGKHMQLPEELLPWLEPWDKPVKVEIEVRIREIKQKKQWKKNLKLR